MKKEGEKPADPLFLRSIVIALIITALCMVVMAQASFRISSRAINDLAVFNYKLITDTKAHVAMQWFSENKLTLENQCFVIASEKASRKEIQDYLTSYLKAKDDPYVYDIYFTSTGNVMASGTGYDNLVEDPDIDYRQRQWYIKASETDDVIYSTAYRDLDSGQLVITLSKRVMRGSRMIGVLAIDVFVDSLTEFFTNESTLENSYGFLVDADMGVIIHPDKDSFYYDESPYRLDETGLSDYPKIIDSIKEDKQGVVISDYDGVKRAIYFQEINTSGWYVINAIDNSLITAGTTNLRNQLLGVAALIILFSIAIDIFVRFRQFRRSRRAFDEVSDKAYMDSLTMLFNRRAYEEDSARLKTGKGMEDLILVSLDINGLKDCNDNLGHAAGDELLKGAAQCMKTAFDKNSKIYRTGGDEFSVIIHRNVEDAHTMLSRLDAELDSWEGELVKTLAVSYGFVAAVEHPELSFVQMEALADELMYASKAEYYRRSGNDRRLRE
ncbi:MAG: diguanylate cyclase [Clostridiales bacterium]|nr:diguanylate cyclase [Clostridiales bacterium]